MASWLASEVMVDDDDSEAVEAALKLAQDLVHVTAGQHSNTARQAILRNLQNGAAPGGF
jgi:electron transfer flavoprotein alpha/beta subunit